MAVHVWRYEKQGQRGKRGRLYLTYSGQLTWMSQMIYTSCITRDVMSKAKRIIYVDRSFPTLLFSQRKPVGEWTYSREWYKLRRNHPTDWPWIAYPPYFGGYPHQYKPHTNHRTEHEIWITFPFSVLSLSRYYPLGNVMKNSVKPGAKKIIDVIHY